MAIIYKNKKEALNRLVEVLTIILKLITDHHSVLTLYNVVRF